MYRMWTRALTAAVEIAEVWEAPDVWQTDRETGNAEYELDVGAPVAARRKSWVNHREARGLVETRVDADMFYWPGLLPCCQIGELRHGLVGEIGNGGAGGEI